MGKFTGAIIGAALLTVGVVTGNPGLALAGGNMLIASTVALLFAPSMPKPDAAQSQKKESRPVRTKGIGTRRVFGKAMFWDTNQNGETVDVLAFLSGRSHAMRQPYLNDDKVTITAGVVQELSDGAYDTGKVLAGVNLGLPTETAFSAVISALPGVWTEDHRGDGITSGYLIKKPVKSKNYLKTYPQADNTTLSAVFDMSYLFDPRDSTMDAYDPDTWVKSEPLLDNPVLGLLWYLITDRGVDYDTQILPVIDYWISAADHCDEPVALKGGGTERRYRCCILFDMTSEPADIISEILKTFDGWYAEDSLGRYIVYSGRYYEPTVTIGPAQIVNARHQGFVEDEDFINEIAITYVSADHDYNEPDATPWTDDVDIAERGKVNSTNFSPQTPSHSQNRRLAKRFMARQNAVDRGTITTNYDGMSVIGERFIWLEHAEAGTSFYTGPAEIVTSPEKDMQTLGVSFDWVAVSPSIDSWNAATEEGEPAPVEGRIAPSPLPAPTITTATAELGDGGSTARVRITVDGFDRDDITWFARSRVSTDPSWNEQEYSDIDPGPSAVLLTSLVALDVAIDVQVAYSVGDGRVSPWSALESVSTSTAGLAPSPPTGVSGTGGTLEADIDWTNAPSPNLAYSRVYRNSANSYSGSTLVSSDLASAPGAAQSFRDEPAAGGWYYFVVGFNASGTGSSSVGTGLVTVV